MKKLFLTLMALAATMSIDAQMVKIMNGDQLVVRHKVPNGGKVVFEKAPDLGIKGKTERTGGIEVNWVQLWEGGPRFAEYNVGAENNKAEDFGGYYNWGMSAVQTKENAEYYQSGSFALMGNDDTASNLWGSNWRLPTKEELEALLNEENCTCTWIENYEGKVVNGLLCKGKGDYEENSVFLPAAGDCTKGVTAQEGYCGVYWSSTPDGSYGTYILCISSYGQLVQDYIRHYGSSVRAVLNEAYVTDGNER